MDVTTLSLSVDEGLVRRLNQLAAEQGTDVDLLVTHVLHLLARQDWEKDGIGPLTRRAMGLAAGLPDRPLKELVAEAIMEKYGKGL